MTIQVRSNDPVDTQKVEAPKGAAASEVTKSAPADEDEQNESTESDTEETEAEGNETDESDGEGSEEETESKDAEKDKPKKKGGFQKRIDKLSSRAANAEREAEYWRNLATSKQDAGDAKKEKVEAKSVAAGEPEPGDYDTHRDYVKALTAWEIDQRDKDREQKEQAARMQSEQKSMLQAHSERVKAFAEKTEDFNEVLESLGDDVRSPTVAEIIMQSENGPELLYALAKDPAEAKRICALSPLAAARELGKLEARIKAPEAKNQDPKKLTNAPKPLEPVGKGAAGQVRKSIFDQDISQADYERLRREQMKRKQG